MYFALRRAHQWYLFMNSNQVAIQLVMVTTKIIHMRTQAMSAKHLYVER